MVQNPLLEGTWRSKAGTISPWECRVCSVVDLAPAHAGAFEVTAPGTSRETANRGDGVSYVSFPFAKTGCRHSHDLIACRNHFPGCCVGGGACTGFSLRNGHSISSNELCKKVRPAIHGALSSTTNLFPCSHDSVCLKSGHRSASVAKDMLPTPRKGNQTPPRIDRGVDRPEESQNAEFLSYPQAGN